MHKTMIAKYKGLCALSGSPIMPGDQITYDTTTKQYFLCEPGDCNFSGAYLGQKNRVSNIFSIGRKEYFRNKSGRCIDAPCCGCCTI